MFEPETGSRRLRCDFPEAETHRIDKSIQLKTVDFVWQPPSATWLVEIKDPEATPEEHREGAVQGTIQELRTGKLVDEHFLPKLFGTYVWLRRQGVLKDVPHRYAILIVMPLDAALRNAATDRIQREVDAIGPLDRTRSRAPVAELHDLVS